MLYFVTIYDKEKSLNFELTLHQLWLGYEKKREGFFKVRAHNKDIDRLRRLVGWDKILRVV